MNGFYADIEQETLDNTNFRHVVYTGDYMQLVYMRLLPNEEIGIETHGNDQFFRFEKGEGVVRIDDNRYDVRDGQAIIVPAGATHNVTNASSDEDLLFYTIYAPSHHADGTIHSTKDDAAKSEESFNGKPTE